jgi:hypothetical protein
MHFGLVKVEITCIQLVIAQFSIRGWAETLNHVFYVNYLSGANIQEADWEPVWSLPYFTWPRVMLAHSRNSENKSCPVSRDKPHICVSYSCLS